MTTEYAKKSWQSAGLTVAGLKAVGELIDKLAANIAAGKGKWDAYERFATYSGHDPRGSLELIMAAVKQTTV